MGWNYLSIPKLRRCNRWSLGMDKQFHPTLYRACDYLSMLGFKLNHVSKMGSWKKKNFCNPHPSPLINSSWQATRPSLFNMISVNPHLHGTPKLITLWLSDARAWLWIINCQGVHASPNITSWRNNNAHCGICYWGLVLVLMWTSLLA